MVFNTQQILDYFIPDSPGDVGALLFWFLLILLGVIMIIDIRLYLRVRNTTLHPEKQPLNHPTDEQMKILQEQPASDITEIRKKVDRLIQINKL